jgi:hypothetical protein
MKTFVFAAFIALSVSALADDGGAGYGAEDVIADGGLTTVVGGCADARVIQSGDNTEIVYTEPCNFTQTMPRGQSDYFTVFKTWEEAEANCFSPDYVQGVLGWRFRLIGFACAPNYNQNGGGN